MFSCHKCSIQVPLDNLYILDECSHRFCQPCILNHVNVEIRKTSTVNCPLPDCKKDLSVRDMKELLPKSSSSFSPTASSSQATQRLLAELKQIMNSDPKKHGYSVKPINDNLYFWKIKMFGFDEKEPFGSDVAKAKKKCIELQATFPKSFPFEPPFIRVIRPRFKFRTGHVTVGGSICTELLTKKGWSPANSVEAAIVSIRAQFITGNARLDFSNRHDYSEQEAKVAYDRMVREHGW